MRVYGRVVGWATRMLGGERGGIDKIVDSDGGLKIAFNGNAA